MKMVIFALLLAAVPGYMIFPDVKTISGRVTDSSGSPVTGAIIMVKGQSTATSTDSTGYFSLTIPDDTKIIVISAVGFDTKEIKITSSNDPLKIILNDTIKELQEVVVMGYSSKIVRSLQGSASGVIIRGSRSTKANRKNKHLPYTSNHLPQPDFNTEDYDNIVENRFLKTSVNPLSTFSIDVDGASYSNVRRFLQNGQLPPAGAVRVEELINYFHYDYPQPKDDAPFSINTEMAECPWNNKNKLVMIGLQGRKISVDNLPASNIVFLIDVSGSMEDENKLPLVKSSIKLLIEQLREEDRVSMVVYAGNAGLVLPSTSGAQKQKIRDAVDRLEAGGSTAGGAGIQLAYKVARENFLKQGNNRVILCTDGDFNVGVSSDASLVQLIEKERESGVFLTVLGYGMGNYKDNKMQQLADRGNGNHAYIDNLNEAKKVLVNEFGGTLFTIAKDVKLQIEFNPTKVQAYRLIGYENRLLNKEDFNNDKKDAGDIGSGHTVTALYELIPVGVESDFIEDVDPLKYSKAGKATLGDNDEMMNIKFRYKQPDGVKSMLLEHGVKIDKVVKTSDNFRFVAAVAEFGMLLNNSAFKQGSSFNNARKLADGAIGKDEEGYRKEFIELISKARRLSREEDLSKTEE